MPNLKNQPPRPKRKTKIEFTVKDADTLLHYLQITALPERSKTTVKQLMRDRFFSVNGKPEVQHNLPLAPGDVVVLHQAPLPDTLHHPQVEILYQDDYLVVANKQPGISTIASGVNTRFTAMKIISEHLKMFDPTAKLFMLNRLDRESQGLVMFAKNRTVQQEIINNWHKYVLEQRFLVVIEGKMEDPEGDLLPPEHPNASKKKTTPKHKNAPEGALTAEEIAELGTASYKVLKEGPLCSMLDIRLDKGRNNQLRKQFREMESPVAGDHHNGSMFKDLGMIALKGSIIKMKHPITGEDLSFQLEVPSAFKSLVKTAIPPTSNKSLKDKKQR